VSDNNGIPRPANEMLTEGLEKICRDMVADGGLTQQTQYRVLERVQKDFPRLEDGYLSEDGLQAVQDLMVYFMYEREVSAAVVIWEIRCEDPGFAVRVNAERSRKRQKAPKVALSDGVQAGQKKVEVAA